MRYGGYHGIRLAENFFKISTNGVIDVMRTEKTWGYARAFAASLLLNATLVRACGLNKKESRKFFSFVYDRWRITLGFGKDQTLSNVSKRLSTESTNKLYSVLWQFADVDCESDMSWLDSWKQECKSFATLLNESLTRKRLKFSLNMTRFMRTQHIPPKWVMLLSLVHMSNNRLGIVNADEVYQAHVLRKCI